MKEPQDRIQKKNLLLSYYTKGDASSNSTTAAANANESTGKSARGDTTTTVSSSSLGTAATETTTNTTNTNTSFNSFADAPPIASRFVENDELQRSSDVAEAQNIKDPYDVNSAIFESDLFLKRLIKVLTRFLFLITFT